MEGLGGSRVVLFVEPTHVQVGGVGVFDARVASHLADRGWKPVFALTRGRRFHRPEQLLANLPPLDWVELDGRSGSSEGRRLAVREVLRRVRPHVVVPGAVLDAWAVLEEAKRTASEAPRILYGVHGIALKTLAFVREHAGFIDAGFAVGPSTEMALTGYCGVPRERVAVVPSGVERALHLSSPEPADPVRLYYVGRFDPDKRVLDGIRLAEELSSRGVLFHLTFIGSGAHQEELERAAAQSGGRMEVWGPVPPAELYESVYPRADGVLIFSESEGLANVLVEAMAHGAVPITSDFLGRSALGLYTPGETALVFPVGDLRAAADRVGELVRTAGLKSRIGVQARKLVEETRSVSRMADSFARRLEAAVEGPPRVGVSDPLPLVGKSRLRKVVGPRASEGMRRLFGRQFAHRDAEEWPLIDGAEPSNDPLARQLLAEALSSSISGNVSGGVRA